MRTTIAILGGTGFIGTALVRRLLQSGFSVSVMARNTSQVPDLFRDKNIRLHRGNVHNAEDVRQAISGATCVVNLAHGSNGGSSEETCRAMVESTETVARACLEYDNLPLVHISSIAALYLGPQPGTINGKTPTDTGKHRRPYARAKALSESCLQQLQRDAGLRLCILRPGLVVGAGTSPFHSGIGSCNEVRGCSGWSSGYNPLPFVLVDDVAEAIVLACTNPASYGKVYNLVGDIRPNAREYLAKLSAFLSRPLLFRAQNPYGIYFGRLLMWGIKRLAGVNAPRPSLRDIVSRSLKAQFDCSDIKDDLGWTPSNDEVTFYRKAFESSRMQICNDSPDTSITS